MSFLEEEKTGETGGGEGAVPAVPPQEDVIRIPASPAPSPSNEYWVRSGAPGPYPGMQRPTTPHGYGQGYPVPPAPPVQGPPVQGPPVQGQLPLQQGFAPQQGFQPQYGQPQPPPYARPYPPYGPPTGQQGAGGYPPYPPAAPGSYRPGQYQYTVNSGWKQAPAKPPESYQWNFEDYDKAAAPKGGKKRSRGLVVFVVAMVCVLGLAGMTFAGWGIYSYLSAGDAQAMEPGEAESASEAYDAGDPDAQPLELSDKPQINETLPLGGTLTVPQIARAVGPSIVGVIQYQPDMYLRETGEGSGIIMSSDGYVITNWHVVNGGQAFKVVLPDGARYDAELVGSDDQTDLAVLKIKGATNLTPAVFGDSTQIEVGELAVVIGNPGGTTLSGSVTRGIISAVNREIPGDFTIPLIQTDAAINPGNSGGALVNEYGQVIGIPSSKLVASGFEGICFAIPITEAKPIIDDIVAHGRVTGRVKLGINAQEIDEIDARNYNLMEGIRIVEIFEDSDLNNTQIQRFDIITHIDGERVTDTASLKKILDRYDPGDRVTLSIFRAVTEFRNDTFEVEITLQEDS